MLPNLYQQNGGWHIRFRQGGKRLSKKIGSLANYPLERNIAPVYHAFMAERTQQQAVSSKDCTLERFVQDVFWHYAEKKKKPSTVKGYKQIWNAYLVSELGNIKLSEFRRADAKRVLEKLAEEGYSQNLIQNGKIVLSSIFKKAVNAEYVDANPIHGLKLESEENENEDIAGFYTLAEIERVLVCLKGLPKAIVATFAFAALRPGELAALQWSDYDGNSLSIERSVWDGKVGTPKTKGSKASVPVIGPLRLILDEYKATVDAVSWTFPGATGKPIRLQRLADRHVRPAFKVAGVQWKGWYAFRRGAATYLLLDMGLGFDEVRAILRHDMKSKVLEKHYAAEVAKRAAQKKQVLAIGVKIDAGFAQRKAEQEALLIAAAQKAPRMVN